MLLQAKINWLGWLHSVAFPAIKDLLFVYFFRFHIVNDVWRLFHPTVNLQGPLPTEALPRMSEVNLSMKPQKPIHKSENVSAVATRTWPHFHANACVCVGGLL